MASGSVSAPMAQVFTFPRAKKRGRKVAKGPKADVHVLYEAAKPSSVKASPGRGPIRSVEEEMSRLEELAAKARARSEAYHAWLQAQPYVVQFPASRRVRSLRDEGLIQTTYGALMAREPGLTPEAGFRRAMKAQEEAGPLIA